MHAEVPVRSSVVCLSYQVLEESVVGSYNRTSNRLIVRYFYSHNSTFLSDLCYNPISLLAPISSYNRLIKVSTDHIAKRIATPIGKFTVSGVNI